MPGINFPFQFLRKKSPNRSGANSTHPKSQQPVVLKPSAPPPPPKTLAALEREMEAQAQYVPTRPHQTSPPAKSKGGFFSKLAWAAILLGIPIGVVWVANLPYSPIRRSVADKAPILLLPSYMSWDDSYRQAIASLEQARQLIDNPTSPADLDAGEQALKVAQDNLDALPLWFVEDWVEYRYDWYDWRFTPAGFRAARAEVGELQAKVFQQQNAQTLLAEGEGAIAAAKQQYQQAATPTDKQAALAAWRSALNQLEQVPSVTLAGMTARTKLDAYHQDFQEVVGLAADNERTITLIFAAQQFSWQAAKASQNPPHTVAEWERIEGLWREAIVRLEQIPAQDLAGYAKAQESLATYQSNLGQIRVRKQAEADSVQALEQAQARIESLLRYTPTDANSLDRNRTISQLQGIINQLAKVQNGTTAYLKAQELLLSAQNKLKQLQP